MTKNSIGLFSLLLAFILGAWMARYYYAPKSVGKEDATVLLEKIEAVKKLITVEGHFSEIYNYSEYEGYFSLLWDKKALVRVRATVSAGYDLNNMQFKAIPETRTIHLDALPEPKILSIDHTLDYYDLSQGIFNSFSAEDYNKINQHAKDLIRDQAQKSNLLTAAKEQGEKTLGIIRYMVESAGWKLVIGAPALPDQGK